ncbi:palladin-like isoform X1 [Lampetra planeri]
MAFRALNQTKPKVEPSPQVDFRAVLNKKKTPPAAGASPDNHVKVKETPEPKKLSGNIFLQPKQSPQGEQPKPLDASKTAKGHFAPKVKEAPPAVATSAPKISQALSDAEVLEGEKVVLQCRVVGQPAPKISWTVNGKAVRPSKDLAISQEGDACTLTVAKAGKDVAGQYVCLAENSAGKASCKANLGVVKKQEKKEEPPVKSDNGAQQIKPRFTKTLRDVEVVEGSAAKFECKVEGNPDPEVTWYKNDDVIEETLRVQVEYEENGTCTLTITEVLAEDDARYTCKALNAAGEDSCSGELLVELMEVEEDDGGKEEDDGGNE